MSKTSTLFDSVLLKQKIASMLLLLIVALLSTAVIQAAPTIDGEDANNNGIRDDVDWYISKQKWSEQQRLAAESLAQAMQEALLNAGQDKEQARAIGNRIGKATTCLYEAKSVVEPPSLISTKIETLTFNTWARKDSYKKFNSAVSGMAFRERPCSLISN